MTHIKNTLLISVASIAILSTGAQNVSADSTASVKSGQTLSSIASENNVSIDSLIKANGIKNQNLIFVGQNLTIPSATPTKSVIQPTPQPVSESQSTTDTYKVSANDTLWQIANKNNMSVNELKSLNQLSSDIIYVGQILKVHKDTTDVKNEVTQTPSEEKTTPQQTVVVQSSEQYMVQSGDTLNQIALKTGVSIDKLVQLNSLTNPNLIAIGQTLNLVDQNDHKIEAQSDTHTATNVQQSNEVTNETKQDTSQNTSWYDIATSLIGTPYVWGGKTPSGFDCSGFVAYVLNKSGRTTNFPAYTVSAESAVTQIKTSNAKPGDLLFWGDKGATYHIAIYLGNNQFIDAPHPGSNVSIETISPYWEPDFAGTVN